MKKWLLIGLVLVIALSVALVACGKSEAPTETPGEGKLVTAGTVQIPDGPKIKVVFNGPPELEVSWQELGTTGIYGWVIQLDGTLKNASNETVTFSEIAYLLDGYQVAYDNGPSTYGQVLAPGEEMRVLKGVDIYSEKTKVLEVKINGFEKIGGPATTPSPTPAPTPTLAPANFSSWAEAAISWGKAKGGSYEWYDEENNQGYCLRFVANAFRQRGPEPEGEWNSAWEASQNLTRYDEEAQKAPRGSLIFFGKTADNRYGHVGIYLGNGKLIHAYGKVRIDDIDQVRNLDKGQLIGSYIGWAYPPEKWRPTKIAEVSLGPLLGPVGTEVTVNGAGFTAGGLVSISYDLTIVVTTTADSSGAFSATFIVPFGPRGNHTITVTDGTNTKQFIFCVE